MNLDPADSLPPTRRLLIVDGDPGTFKVIQDFFGPNGYLRQAGMIAAPNNIRARSQQAARGLAPLNLASLK